MSELISPQSPSFDYKAVDNGDDTITITATMYIDQSSDKETADDIDEVATGDDGESIVPNAMDAAPSLADVKTPFFKCRAADPCKCRFHGAGALKTRLMEMLKTGGVKKANVKVMRDKTVHGIGRYRIEVTGMKGDKDAILTALEKLNAATGGTTIEKASPLHGRRSSYGELLDIDFLDSDADSDEVEHPILKGKKSDDAKSREDGDEGIEDSPTWKTMEEFLVEASKIVTAAAKTINRSIDREGTKPPNEGKVDKCLEMKDGLLAAYHDEGISEHNADQALALLKSIDEIAASKEGGYKEKITNVPFFTPMGTTPVEGEKAAEKPVDEEEMKEIAADDGETAEYLRAVAAELEPESALREKVKALAKREELALLKKAESEKSSDKKEGLKADAEGSDGGVRLSGFGIIEDGDTGADINRKRAAMGLSTFKSLDVVDSNVKDRDANLREATRLLAEKYGDKELDISDPAVFAEVEKNWAETVKAIANEGRFVSFLEPRHVLGFMSSGVYKTSFDYGDLARKENVLALYGIKVGDENEAPLSATIVGGENPEDAFKTPCCNRFGPICIEWRKDGDMIPVFSNCDAAEPAEQDRESGRAMVYQPSLISNPKLCSLAALCNGVPSIEKKVGRKSSSGKTMMSFAYAIKLLRKGPIAKTATEFDAVVNGADKSPVEGILFGWNETPMIGRGTTKNAAAIRIDSKKWNELRASSHEHGTDDYTSASSFVDSLIKSHGSALKSSGIKVILDGKEIPV